MGWVKLHRKLLLKSWFNRSTIVHLFIFLLLKASNTDKKVFFNGKEEVIKRGSLIIGIQSISKETGISIQSIRTGITALKSTNTITCKSTNRFTIIQIVNYDQYQTQEEKITSEPTSELTNKQQTTNKQLTNSIVYYNIKNIKNIKKINNNVPLSLIEFFNEKFSSRYQLTEGRRRKIALRLKTFTPDQIKTAILNLSQSPFHRGENERGWTADPDFLFRSDEQIDKWLQKGNRKEFFDPLRKGGEKEYGE